MAKGRTGAKADTKAALKPAAKKDTKAGDQDAARRNAIELAVSSIEKQFGKGAIQTMDQDGARDNVPCFSSGGPSIDIALGIGG